MLYLAAKLLPLKYSVFFFTSPRFCFSVLILTAAHCAMWTIFFHAPRIGEWFIACEWHNNAHIESTDTQCSADTTTVINAMWTKLFAIRWKVAMESVCCWLNIATKKMRARVCAVAAGLLLVLSLSVSCFVSARHRASICKCKCKVCH